MYEYCDEKIDIGHSWDFLHVKGSEVLLNWSHLPILIMALEVRSPADHVSITLITLGVKTLWSIVQQLVPV